MIAFKGYSNYSWIKNPFYKPMIIHIYISHHGWSEAIWNSMMTTNMKKVTTFWKELWTEKDFCDVTLLCEDSQIQIHKVILSSISPGYLINVIIKQQLSIVFKYINRSTQKYKIYMWAMWRQSNNKRNSQSSFQHSAG